MIDPEVMPVAVAIRFAHAVAQAVADRHGIRVLHIKGPAVDESLLDLSPPADGHVLGEPVPRRSTDADVWVDPRSVDRFMQFMRDHEWDLEWGFEDDSAFGHAATLRHAKLGHLDVHRSFPGIRRSPQTAFDTLWQGRAATDIAGRLCPVPAIPAQRLILILHAARGAGGPNNLDIRRAWGEATASDRLAVRGIATELRAEVALAAGTGELESFRGHRNYWLWRLLSEPSGHSMIALWAARVWAEPTPLQAAKTSIRLLLPKPERLKQELGRAPTWREIALAYIQRISVGAREFRQWLQ